MSSLLFYWKIFKLHIFPKVATEQMFVYNIGVGNVCSGWSIDVDVIR